MFSWITDLLSKLWNWIRKILAILLVVLAVVLIVWAIISGLWIFAVYGLLALGAAFLIDEDTASETVGRVAEVVGNVTEAVADVVGSTVGSAAGGLFSGLLSSPFGIAAVGIGAYLLFRNDSGPDSRDLVVMDEEEESLDDWQWSEEDLDDENGIDNDSVLI